MTGFNRFVFAVLFLVAGHSFASDAPVDLKLGDAASIDKPIAYNFVIVPVGPTDRLISEHFEELYSIVDIEIGDMNTYRYAKGVTQPRAVKGFGPLEPLQIENRCVPGNVLVGFVIKADGTVTSLSVLKSTEPLLNDFALQRVSRYLCQPAEVESKPVALITATWLPYKCGT